MRNISVREYVESESYNVELNIGNHVGTRYGAMSIGLTKEEAMKIRDCLHQLLEEKKDAEGE